MKSFFTIRIELLIATGLSIYLAYDIYKGDAPAWEILTDTVGVSVFLYPALFKWKYGKRRRSGR